MANILPEAAVRNVWGEFRARAFLTGALALLGTAVFWGIMLLPAYLVLQIEQSSAAPQDSPAVAVSSTSAERAAERADLLRSQSSLARIAPVVMATSSPSQSVSAALALRPSGVSIDAVKMSSERGEITLEGTVVGRDAINQYREALIGSGKFGGVSVPVDALVGASGGHFSVTLTGIF